MVKNKRRLDELAELLKNPPHNLWVDVYNEDIKVIKEPSVKKHKSKYTLNQLGEKVDKLSETVNKIGDALFEFIKTTNARFDRIEARLDRVETRLDYVIKANNLKDLSKQR